MLVICIFSKWVCRYLNQLILDLLYGFKYLDAVDDNGDSVSDKFLIEERGTSDVSAFSITERIYKFMVVDARVIPDRLVGDVPAILSIDHPVTFI